MKCRRSRGSIIRREFSEYKEETDGAVQDYMIKYKSPDTYFPGP